MKKIVRLTESDLVRLVKRVINEQATSCMEPLQSHLEGLMNLGPNFKEGQKKKYRDNLVRDCGLLETYIKNNPNVQFGSITLKENKTAFACVTSVNFGNQQEDKDMAVALAKVGAFVKCVKDSIVKDSIGK